MSMVRVARKKLNDILPKSFRVEARKLLYRGSAIVCPLCQNSVRTYLSWGGDLEVLERRKVVGGMRRTHDQCPVCRSSDRTRLIMLYLRSVLSVQMNPLKILHFAPEQGLYLWLSKFPQLGYQAADLDLRRYRHLEGIIQTDITDLPFESETFDVVICSHVLEHVPDDLKAMAEMKRVLKPDGRALLMVPLATDGLPTDEDPSIVDIPTREQRFGQWDHVRLYSPDDFMARLVSAGFETTAFDAFAALPHEASELGLNPLETLIVASPASTA
jgi:SAM-dependent methyltransferase